MTKKTYTVEEAAVVLGIGRSAAYEGVNNDQIPNIRIGHRILVPVAALDRMLEGETSRTPTSDTGEAA